MMGARTSGWLPFIGGAIAGPISCGQNHRCLSPVENASVDSKSFCQQITRRIICGKIVLMSPLNLKAPKIPGL